MNKIGLHKNILLLALLLTSYCYSQEYFLKLDKVIHGEVVKTRTYYEGHWVRLKTLDGNKYKGNYFVVDESTIHINDQKIKLDDILKIRFDNKHFFGGIVMTTLGLPLFFGGLLATAFEEGIITKREDPSNNAEIATGIGIASFIGGMVILSNKDKRLTKKKWQLSILAK